LEAADATNSPVSIFADKRLEAAVRQQVFAKRGTQEPLTAADVGTVSTVSAPFAGITNLTGLEHCRSLAMLELPGNRIVDLRPLSGLKEAGPPGRPKADAPGVRSGWGADLPLERDRGGSSTPTSVIADPPALRLTGIFRNCTGRSNAARCVP
jgi:hypothetical protein